MIDEKFVGRDREIEEFKEFLVGERPNWDETSKGAPLLIVTGEIGIGKRPLLQEMAKQAYDQGHFVFSPGDLVEGEFNEQMRVLISMIKLGKRFEWGTVDEWLRFGAAMLGMLHGGLATLGNLLIEIRKEHKKAEGEYLGGKLHSVLKELNNQIKGKQKIIVILYPRELSEANSKNLISILERVQVSEVPEKVRFVVAQKPKDTLLVAVDRRVGHEDLRAMCSLRMTLGRLNKNDSRKYVEVHDNKRKLNAEMRKVFIEKYDGWPYLMKLGLEELEKVEDEITEKIIKKLPEDINTFWELRYNMVDSLALRNFVETVNLLPHPYKKIDIRKFAKLEADSVAFASSHASVRRLIRDEQYWNYFADKPEDWGECPSYQHPTSREYIINRLKSEDEDLYQTRLNNIISHYREKIRDVEKKGVDRDALVYVTQHIIAAKSWDEIESLLTNIEYLKKMQSPQEQYHFQSDFISLINNEEIPNDKLANILKGVLNTIREQMPTSNEKADWLDIFALWINEFGIKDCTEKSLALKKIANKFDYACGEVSKELADDYLKKGESSWALRFAELCTWVYEQAGDYSKYVGAYRDAKERGLQEGMEDAYIECVKACRYAEGMCLQKGMEDAYRYLGQAEFIRLRAHAFTILSNKIATDESKKAKYEAKAREAYEELNKVFPAEGGESQWPGVKDWEELEELSGKSANKVLTPPSQSGSGQSRAFRAKVVSNLADSISAMHVIQFFEEQGGLVEWIHHKNFKLEQFAPENTLFTVLIGGPKSSGISKVAFEFYETDKENFIDMFSGLSFKAHRLHIEKHIEKDDKTHCYMLGGASKVFTLKAAYEFTKDDEVNRIIKRAALK